MYYKDWSEYKYDLSIKIPELLNIGWLDSKHNFVTGVASSEFVTKLEQLLLTKTPCQVVVNQMRGLHCCELCEIEKVVINNGIERRQLGSAEIVIPRINCENIYFVAPTLVYHYIVVHSYLPPEEFIDSILAVDLYSKFDGEILCENLVKKYY